MANVTTFVKNVKPHCREHGILKKGYNKKNLTFFCEVCEVATTSEEIQKNCYSPYFYQQSNPFIEFK